MRPSRGLTARQPSRPAERGAATVLAVALLGLLVLVASALSVVAAILVGHRSAQAAADLAALAGASVVMGPGEPCAAAAAVAQANGARLDQCAVVGRDVVVTVAVSGPQWRGWVAGDLLARSRAGPAP